MQRIQYKILIVAFKSTHEVAPPYLAQKIQAYETSRPLRTEQQHLLALPATRPCTTYGERTLQESVPVAWNTGITRASREAETLSDFKTKVKTNLFRTAFNL